MRVSWFNNKDSSSTSVAGVMACFSFPWTLEGGEIVPESAIESDCLIFGGSFYKKKEARWGKALQLADFLNPGTSRTPVFWERSAWGWVKGLMRVREIRRGEPNDHFVRDQEHLKVWPDVERKPTDEAKIGVMWWNDPELQGFDSSEERWCCSVLQGDQTTKPHCIKSGRNKGIQLRRLHQPKR